jgi:hypothetical protein
LARAEKLALEEEMPILPLFVFVNVYCFRPEVEGVFANRRLINPLKDMWIRR